ncbi:hypothetical protein FEM48_Zijuj03G0006500 [Ziziphus jujuba var. spinosa]|uniref:Annexin D4-like n=1 Tax=Ziziphus jujuba var. spinosa TaxID=714518 RepID=A0A978VM70_ZIZJJ|nr:hypothetical protein FEM48_Zijuj03G0006500 [Ziziphus jujuba var. spinosa]
MALSHDLGTLTKAFSGLGVDEKSLISILGKWHPEQTKSFRKGSSDFFVEDERLFERWDDHRLKLLKHEFLRFKNAVVLWTMHPWERDARLIKEALKKGPQSYGIIVEVACSRSSEELLGARRAYHSLFDHSIEEDVAHHIHGTERKLLVALVSAYRYEGQKVKDDTAKSEAKTLANAFKNADNKNPIEDDEVDLDGDLRLKETVQCLCAPHKYFSKVLEAAMRNDADKSTSKGLTRVVVTRADTDMKLIKEEFHSEYGVSLSKKIEDSAHGNYKDFLLTLIARGD